MTFQEVLNYHSYQTNQAFDSLTIHVAPVPFGIAKDPATANGIELTKIPSPHP